ncbi:hypothetical protein Tco_0514189, partial [Tanacetum coccineum]
NRIKHIPVICQKDMPRMVSIGDVVRAVASKLEAKKEVKEAKKEVKETKKEDKPVVANKKDAKQFLKENLKPWTWRYTNSPVLERPLLRYEGLESLSISWDLDFVHGIDGTKIYAVKPYVKVHYKG